MRVLIFGDPISGLSPKGDTSLSLIREGLKRGYEFHWATLEDFFLKETKLFCFTEKITACQPEKLPEKEAKKRSWDHAKEVSSFDTVWIRKDPPFEVLYLSLCWLLSIETKETLILNHPLSLCQYHEKLLPVLAVREGYLDESDIHPFFLSTGKQFEFPKEMDHKNLVSKPWYGFGGRGVRTWKSLDEIEAFGDHLKKEYVIFQEQVKDIETKGDRRVFYLDAKQCGSFVRLPKKGMVQSNLAQGGSAILRDMSDQEKKVSLKVEKFLKDKEIFFSGIDLMDGKVSEINITSPTGFETLKELTGIRLDERYCDLVEEKLKK